MSVVGSGTQRPGCKPKAHPEEPPNVVPLSNAQGAAVHLPGTRVAETRIDGRVLARYLTHLSGRPHGNPVNLIGESRCRERHRHVGPGIGSPRAIASTRLIEQTGRPDKIRPSILRFVTARPETRM